MPMIGDSELLALFDRDQRRDVEWGDTTREQTPETVRHLGLNDKTIVISHSSLNDDNADAIIAREQAYATRRGMTLNWKLYTHDRPADLSKRLVAHGFKPMELETVLVLDMDESPAVLAADLPPGVVVRRVTDQEGLAAMMSVEGEVWGGPQGWLASFVEEATRDPGSLSMYVLSADGEPATAGWIRFHPPVRPHWGSLWGGSTRSAYRRRGLYTALLALRAREARERGARFLTVDASPMSRPILLKYGFRAITQAQDHKWGEHEPAEEEVRG